MTDSVTYFRIIHCMYQPQIPNNYTDWIKCYDANSETTGCHVAALINNTFQY